MESETIKTNLYKSREENDIHWSLQLLFVQYIDGNSY